MACSSLRSSWIALSVVLNELTELSSLLKGTLVSEWPLSNCPRHVNVLDGLIYVGLLLTRFVRGMGPLLLSGRENSYLPLECLLICSVIVLFPWTTGCKLVRGLRLSLVSSLGLRIPVLIVGVLLNVGHRAAMNTLEHMVDVMFMTAVFGTQLESVLEELCYLGMSLNFLLGAWMIGMDRFPCINSFIGILDCLIVDMVPTCRGTWLLALVHMVLLMTTVIPVCAVLLGMDCMGPFLLLLMVLLLIAHLLVHVVLNIRLDSSMIVPVPLLDLPRWYSSVLTSYLRGGRKWYVLLQVCSRLGR